MYKHCQTMASSFIWHQHGWHIANLRGSRRGEARFAQLWHCTEALRICRCMSIPWTKWAEFEGHSTAPFALGAVAAWTLPRECRCHSLNMRISNEADSFRVQ